MSRKAFKLKKIQIYFESDAFSIHTFELSIELSKSEWNKCKEQLFSEQKESGKGWIYPDKSCKDVYICTKYADAGIHIRLEHTSGKKAGTTVFA